MTLSLEASFPAAVVRELRGENKRWRLYARDLEDKLIRKELAIEAMRAGIDQALIPTIPTLNITVREDGMVIGAREAVQRFKSGR